MAPAGIFGTGALFFDDAPTTPPPAGITPKNASWGDGTEHLIATSRYLRVVYNGRTVDMPDPLTSIGYEDTPIVGANVTASGKREVMHERDEEVCILTMQPTVPEMFDRLRRMLREWGGRGEQAEVYIDRTLRAYWGFEAGDAYDNNRGNVFSSVEALAYQEGTHGSGVTMPTTGPLRASLISALPGGSGNFFFSPTGGTLVLAFRAGFAGNDGGEHILIDCAAWGGDIGRNRLLVKKRADNFLHVIHYGANSGATALEQLVTWAADTEHVLMVQWGADLTSLSAKLDGVLLAGVNYYHRYGSTRKYGDGLKYGDKSGTPSGAEQVMAGSPTAVMLGTDLAQTAGRFSGAFGALSLYSVAYGLPSVLERYAHPMRTYYPRGEFIDAVFRPIRAQPGAEHYYYTLRIRDGR